MASAIYGTETNNPAYQAAVSPVMRAFERVLTDIAPTDIPVLLIGESGTGKEAVALQLHYRSCRRAEPFVKCNAASLSVDGARWRVFQESTARDGVEVFGTLFLDDISQLDS